MKYSPIAIIGLLLLTACTAAPVPSDGTAASSATLSSAPMSEAVSSASVDLSLIRKALPERDHNFFVVLNTFKEKAAANINARDLGAWVLPTNLTTNLSPDLYAVVYGPFETKAAAEQKGQQQRLPKATYIKDAGAISFPPDMQLFEGLPNAFVAAFAGRMEPNTLTSASLFIKLMEEGGTLCNRTGPAYFVQPLKQEKMFFDTLTPTELDTIKKFRRELTLSKEESQRSIGFEVVEESGEILGPSLCFD